MDFDFGLVSGFGCLTVFLLVYICGLNQIISEVNGSVDLITNQKQDKYQKIPLPGKASQVTRSMIEWRIPIRIIIYSLQHTVM